MSTGDWGPFWVGLSVPVCCSLSQTLEIVAFSVALSTKTLENEAQREPPRRKFLEISQLDNPDFGRFWAGHLNSKFRSNYFLKYVISISTKNVFGIIIDLLSGFTVIFR